MVDIVHRELIEVLIRARNETSAAFKSAAADASSFGASIRTAALGFGAVGLTAGIGAAALVKMGADFESSTQALANNTNMGAAGLAAMRKNALDLQTTTGQAAGSIAEGYMYIANHAYSGAAATNILTAATKNAAATNGDAAQTANVLVGILKEYNVSQDALAKHADLATRYMDVLHNAVANSNFTVNDFVEGGKRAFAVAGQWHVPISVVTAQLAVLSEHGFPSAAVAALNWAGMLKNLEHPHAQALAAMKSLGKAAGVDLVADIAKLQKDGAFLPQFLADVAKATGGDQNKVFSLLPLKGYGDAFAALIQNQKQLNDIQGFTSAAEAGIVLPGMTGTMEAFAKQQHTLIGEVQDLRGSLMSTAQTIGLALVPQAQALLRTLNPLISQFEHWATLHAPDFAKWLPDVGKVAGVAAAIMGVGIGVNFLSAALGMAALPTAGLLVIAGLLGLAYVKNFGDARGAVNRFIDSANQAWTVVQDISKALDALSTGKGIQEALDRLKTDLFPSVSPFSFTGGGLLGGLAKAIPGTGPVGAAGIEPGKYGQMPHSSLIPGVPSPFTQQPFAPWEMPGMLPVPTPMPPLGATPTAVSGAPRATPTPVPAPGPATSQTVHITVHVDSDAVHVHGAGGTEDLGQHVGNHIAQALKELAQTGLNASPRANRLLPGARA